MVKKRVIDPLDDPPEMTGDEVPVDAVFEEIEDDPPEPPRRIGRMQPSCDFSTKVDPVAAEREAVIAAEAATERARARVRNAQIAVRQTRMALSKALAAWQASYAISDANNRRAEMHADFVHRAMVATGQLPGPQPMRVGDSRIDEIAAYSNGRDGASFRRGNGKFRLFRGQKVG